jgi:CDP-glycerol glycerophosphotransferase
VPRITVVPTGSTLGARSRASVERLPVDVEVTGPAGQARQLEGSAPYVLFLTDGESLVASGVLALLESLDRSGSDVALGTADADGAPGSLQTAATRTTVAATPALLQHRTVGAALWRRSWWEGQGVAMPSDPELRPGALARALAAASAVDVVPEPVTAAQARSPRLRRTDLHLRAEDMAGEARRLDDLHAVAGVLPPEARPHWFRTVLEPTIADLLTGLPEADAETQSRLTTRIGAVVSEGGPELVEPLPAVSRLAYHLAARGLQAELLEVVTAERSGANRLGHWVLDGDDHLAPLPFRDDERLTVPREVYRVDDEIDVRGRVESVRWEGSRLLVEGFAHLQLMDIAEPDSDRLSLALVRGSDGRRIELPAERVRRHDVTVRSRDAYCYDWAGFRTSVDTDALRNGDEWRAATWRLEVTVESQGVRRTRFLAATSPGQARNPELRDVDGARLVPVTGRGTFAVEVDLLPAVLTAVSAVDGELRLTGQLRRRTRRRSATLQLQRLSGTTVLEVPVRLAGLVGRQLEARLPLAEVLRLAAHELDAEVTWALRLLLPGASRPVPVRVSSDLGDVRLTAGEADAALDVELGGTAQGRAVLSTRRRRPVVDSARWDGDQVELQGRWPVGLQASFVLAARRTSRDRPLPHEVSGDRFVLRWNPTSMPTLAGDVPLPFGKWLPAVRRTDDPLDDVPLTADREVLAGLPQERQVGAKTYTLTEDESEIDLEVTQDLLEDERGPVNQQRLRWQEFPAFLQQGLVDEVLFESYESRAYGDNARAIFEELRRRVPDLRCRWMVVDGQTALPDGLEPLRRFSRDHFEALARARYVVIPNYRPMEAWFETPKDQVVVQTWHGAPFKRIALDNPRWGTMGGKDNADRIRAESARWDYLLSPNPPSSPILRGAFGFSGEMLDTGYPRTDVFHAPDRERRAAAVKERLGLDPSKRVVLYAPTMRDDHRYSGNRYSLEMRLDLPAARHALADDHVLLVRRHAKVVDTVPGVDGSFAIDVSAWPDVNELLLAVDVLVSDYSSLTFDFAVTGRPMLFFTYDLADYRDRLRGFYFDPDRLPGPHVATSDELITALQDLDGVEREFRPRYAEFAARFCELDDGRAAGRVVDRVFRKHL